MLAVSMTPAGSARTETFTPPAPNRGIIWIRRCPNFRRCRQGNRTVPWVSVASSPVLESLAGLLKLCREQVLIGQRPEVFRALALTPDRSAESPCAPTPAPGLAYSRATASGSPHYAHPASALAAPGAGERPRTSARSPAHRDPPVSDPESSGPCRAGADADAAMPRAPTG